MYQDLKNYGALVSKANSLAKQKQDFLVPANSLTLLSDNNRSYLNVNGKAYNMLDRAERQLAEICSIPYNYYQMLRAEYPDLLDKLVISLPVLVSMKYFVIHVIQVFMYLTVLIVWTT